MTEQVSQLLIDTLGKRVLNLEQQVSALRASNKRLREERNRQKQEEKRREELQNFCDEAVAPPKAFVVDLSDLIRQ